MKGKPLDSIEVERICQLLRESTLSMPEIATRTSVDRATVIRINSEHGIREYGTARRHWTVRGGVGVVEYGS